MSSARMRRDRGWGRCLALLCLLLAGAGCGHGAAPQPAASTSCVWQDSALRAEERQAAAVAWAANLKRNEALVHPSKAYAGVWLRDSFWTFLGLGNTALAGSALRHFVTRQLADGQMPTQFATFLRRPLYRPDESTLLFLLWSAWLAQHHGWRPPRSSLLRALAYIRTRAPHAGYLSGPGGYADWFDGFRLPSSDTLSYMQGLYTASLLAARQLGLAVGGGEVAAAIDGYRALAAPDGYLRFSRHLAYHDISALTGEFLSLWLFGRPLLTGTIVAATIDEQPAYGAGFRVVTDQDGSYLSPHAFVAHFFAGDYQNGGSWLLYDYLGLATGCMHGMRTLGSRLTARLRVEFRDGPIFHEYLNTDPTSPLAGREPSYRDNFSWDTFVLRVDAILAAWDRARKPTPPGR